MNKDIFLQRTNGVKQEIKFKFYQAAYHYHLIKVNQTSFTNLITDHIHIST